jgi:hypothetical protein
VCHSRSLSAVRARAFGDEPDDRQQQPLVRRASVVLAAASPDTSNDQRDAAWLTALEQQALAQSHLPACSGALIRATSLGWRSAKR